MSESGSTAELRIGNTVIVISSFFKHSSNQSAKSKVKK
ncbi:hypothetical protein FYJ51_09585 [Erysipelotrichaceae bacterium Oil+RF-744-GAM-WT-6]|uniref:Uncharacterized protein n=1 Tax=Stecheria intestinalis TaxID=2606630 RepID=A0A7X2NT94_9FIRM|nr:hypothetical protein [Stecheria intestinalis]